MQKKEFVGHVIMHNGQMLVEKRKPASILVVSAAAARPVEARPVASQVLLQQIEYARSPEAQEAHPRRQEAHPRSSVPQKSQMVCPCFITCFAYVGHFIK